MASPGPKQQITQCPLTRDTIPALGGIFIWQRISIGSFFTTGREIVGEQFGDPVVVKTLGCPEGMEVPVAVVSKGGRAALAGSIQ